ncbi:hypothetical protein EDP2_3971 [Enterobacter cloacae S611]|uniref:Uncharacterized protein n=1 Tax=Enterobacter cloacae S611 TaxID=1399146 RepID=A0ABN0QBA3_ENTCL|nr:hypothetical protein EDP2_3971 [Enterobacter cloacae S611]
MIDLTLNVHLRIVPRAQQFTALPKRDHFFKIFLPENTYLHDVPHIFQLCKR